MTEGLTVIIIAHNEYESAKLGIESMRMFADVENLNVVLVDNASTDELKDWASAQQDFTYIYMDEGRENFGEIVNQVVQVLEVDTDIFVMEAHYAITPFALSRMQKVLAEHGQTGVVVPVTNGFYQKQRLDESCTDFQSAMQYAQGLGEYSVERVMGIEGGAFLIRKALFDELGGLENKVKSSHHLLKDLSISLLEKGGEIAVCKGAVLWDLTPFQEVSADSSRFYGSEDDQQVMEEKWGMHYFNLKYNGNIVEEVCEKAKPGMKVLEIGCDLGATLFEIKNCCPDAEIYGCELNEKSSESGLIFHGCKGL